jgi:hypothetical protein
MADVPVVSGGRSEHTIGSLFRHVVGDGEVKGAKGMSDGAAVVVFGALVVVFIVVGLIVLGGDNSVYAFRVVGQYDGGYILQLCRADSGRVYRQSVSGVSVKTGDCVAGSLNKTEGWQAISCAQCDKRP